MSNGHRWSKFWWQDWQNDKALQSCTLAARGLWIEMLGIAHEADPCGHVLINGRAPTIQRLADMLGRTTVREVTKLLAELEDAGVFSRTQDGTIYSRRMVRDAAASEVGREHIARRWNGTDPNSPPTSTPNRVPTREPDREPTREATRPPISPPTPPSPEAEAETDSETKKESINTLTFTSTLREGSGGERGLNSLPPDALRTLLDEMDEGQRQPPSDRLSDDPAIEKHIRSVAKACSMRTPYGEVRSAEAQSDALRDQPAVVGADEAMGLRWQPAEPVRSVEEQRAAWTPEELARAEAAFAQRAGLPHAER